MKAIDYLIGKTLTSIDVVKERIINLNTNETTMGLDIDTSDIEFGTPLMQVSDFIINENILSYGDLTVDLSSVNVLIYEPPIDEQIILE